MKPSSKYSKMSASINNQQGTAIISALLILMLLSIVAITATNTTTTEKTMVRSEAIFEQNFFLAESAAMEGIQKLANKSSANDLLAAKVAGNGGDNDGLIIPADSVDPFNDEANLDTDADGIFDSDDVLAMETSGLDNSTKRLVVQMPIASGGSLGTGAGISRLYHYTSYGFTEANAGRSLIKVGFKKRF